MALRQPEHEFVLWLKKPSLIMDGYKLNWNKTFEKKKMEQSSIIFTAVTKHP